MMIARFALLLVGFSFPGACARLMESKQQVVRADLQVSGFDPHMQPAMEAAQASCSRPADAIVGVSSVSASNLPKGSRLFFEVNPYLKIKLRDEMWESDSIKHNKDPQWTAERQVFCVKQHEDKSPLHLHVQVWDEVNIFADNELGHVSIPIDKEKCKNAQGVRGCNKEVSLSGGGKVKLNIQIVDLAALRAANEKIICKKLDPVHVSTCHMVSYRTVFNPLGTELTTTELDQGAKQSWYNWHTNQVNLADNGMKKFASPDEMKKCEQWASAWFCAQAMPECEGSGEKKKIKKMCKSTCVNFFENCHKDGDVWAKKNCQGLLEDASCTAFDSMIEGAAMTDYVNSQMQDAFIKTVKKDMRESDPKAVPGVSFQSYAEVREGLPLVYGIWNLILHAVDLDVSLETKNGQMTFTAKGRVALTVSFWARLLTKFEMFGLSEHGTVTIDDPAFEISIKARHKTAKKKDVERAEGGQGSVPSLGRAAKALEANAKALTQQLKGEFINIVEQEVAPNDTPWIASQVHLKLNVNLAKGIKLQRWYLNKILSKPLQWLLKGKLRDWIAVSGASSIAGKFAGTNALSTFFGQNLELTAENHIKLTDPTYTDQLESGVALEATERAQLGQGGQGQGGQGVVQAF